MNKRGSIITRTVPNVMQAYGCSAETAQRYVDLRDEGYSMSQAQLMAGLSDPPDDAMTPKRAGMAKAARGETMEPSDFSDEEISALWGKTLSDAGAGMGRFGRFSVSPVHDFARAILAAHEAKKQQDHLTQPVGVRTEPGEENARGVKGPNQC